jgi:hypothetical protein
MFDKPSVIKKQTTVDNNSNNSKHNVYVISTDIITEQDQIIHNSECESAKAPIFEPKRRVEELHVNIVFIMQIKQSQDFNEYWTKCENDCQKKLQRGSMRNTSLNMEWHRWCVSREHCEKSIYPLIMIFFWGNSW